MQCLDSMDKDQALEEIVKKTKIGRGKRLAIMVVAVVGVAVLIAVVVAGFRGRQILQDSAAMTTPIPASTSVGQRPGRLP
jgi:hypothetical protein